MARDKTNAATLWPNDKKTSDRHPDLKGSGLLQCPHCGAEYGVWASAWVNVLDKDTPRNKKGTKWLNVSVEPKQEEQGAREPEERSRPAQPQDIPF